MCGHAVLPEHGRILLDDGAYYHASCVASARSSGLEAADPDFEGFAVLDKG